MQITVTKAVVFIRGPSTDQVRLETVRPPPFPPDVDDTPLALKFEVSSGKGVEYVLANFPGPWTVALANLTAGAVMGGFVQFTQSRSS